jgi:hypothetical protein
MAFDEIYKLLEYLFAGYSYGTYTIDRYRPKVSPDYSVFPHSPFPVPHLIGIL